MKDELNKSADELVLGWPGRFRSNYREARFLLETHATHRQQLRFMAGAGAVAYTLSCIPEFAQPWRDLVIYQFLPRIPVLLYCLGLVLYRPWTSRPDRLERSSIGLEIALMVAFSISSGTSPGPFGAAAMTMVMLILVLAVFIPLNPVYAIIPALGTPAIVLGAVAVARRPEPYLWINGGLIVCLTLVLGFGLSARLRTAERRRFSSYQGQRKARQQAERAIREHQQLFDATPAPVIVSFREGGEILKRNPSFDRMFAVPAQLPTPLTVTAFFRKAEDRAVVLTHIRDRGRQELEIEAQTYDGVPLDVVVTIYEVQVAGRSALVTSFRDVTKERSTERALRKAKEAAEQASQIKSQFLAHMSHEIRTPMNGVLGLAWLLESTTLTEEQKEMVAMMCQSGEGLLRIIDDILDISKVEAGELAVRSEPFEVAALVTLVLAPLRLKAQGRGLDLAVSVAESVPTHLTGDKHRLAQVLINLAGNAIKFTTKGSVTVNLSPGDSVDGPFMLQAVVKDTGPGIAEAELARLFRPFVQLDAYPDRNQGGVGLGLAISKKLVGLMGGELQVQSQLGQGSRFSFQVPMDPVPMGGPASAVTTDAYLASKRYRVLVAEDNHVNRLVASLMLKRLGLEALIVDDGQAAIDTLGTEAFDIILMDVQMPRVDGLVATQWLRAHEIATGQARTPVIAMTAHALAQDRLKCLAAGMDDYLTKPVSLKRLGDVIGRWCEAPERTAN